MLCLKKMNEFNYNLKFDLNQNIINRNKYTCILVINDNIYLI